MALTLVEQVRLWIADRPKLVLNEVVGIGSTVTLVDYRLQFFAVTALSDSLSTRAGAVLTPLVRDTDYTIANATGLITLASSLADGTELLATYTWSVFSDSELTDLLALHGDSVIRTAYACVLMILADADRFIKYSLGQETVDRDAARQALESLLDRLADQMGSAGRLSIVEAGVDTYEEYTLQPFVDQVAEVDY